MSSALLAATALFASQVAAPAQAPAGIEAARWLVGQWRGAGASFGNPGTAALDISPAVGGKFIEFRYTVATSGARAFRFEGRAFYRPSAGGWSAHWFDSRGITFTIDAALSGNVMTSRWSDATESGQTTYRLLDGGRLEVVDSANAPDGNRREFARYVYQRVPAPAPISSD